jgi:prepilin-type N-terminal cleavage/methylation domain-containing protein
VRVTRDGFTLAELIVATAVGGIAAAIMTATVVHQQRFYSSASAVLDVRSQLRDAADVLASDLRGAAVSTLGVPFMSDTAVEIFTTIATSIACASPAGATIPLPPSKLTSGNTLTSILTQPDTGDLAMIYVFPQMSPDSGRWETHRIASFAARALNTSCPPSSGFTTPGDAYVGATGFVLTLTSSPNTLMRKGAPVHFVRRARYSLYRSSDGDWYLGYRRCNAVGASACSSVQPVSGPYRAGRSATGAAGISFRYFDSAGAELTSSASFSVARIDIVLRGETRAAVALAGDSRKVWSDSATVTVSPRNRAR